ncbi:FtsK/SpoIIIE family DNA translocase [Lachnoanaerobaculum gingivalis]|uniref:FtsK/SpoIIIE family DNA translocase n=1 Tax=Lachnoanaerobaculum gingivalis TaxID=2490855 RepID=UPI0024A639EF|nr:DNA translocase FtsK [Lachnoanaerobaculum gingivalis]WHE88072.1 DNA translocase FtsK 4TM domain-containing protein [Lachnoanaerobaculum gingivalis]
MASRKQTTKKTGKTSSRSRAKKKIDNNEQLDFLNSEILMIALFCVSLVLFLSHFGLMGVVGKYLRIFQLGVFGILGFSVPMFVFVGGAFLLSNIGSSLAKIKFAGVLMAVLAIDALISLFGIPNLKEFGLMRFYTEGWYGGFIGGGLGLLISSVLGKIGAIIFFIAVLIISIVILTGKSFVSIVKTGGRMTISRAKNDVARVMEQRKQRREQQLAEEWEYEEEPEFEEEFEELDIDDKNGGYIGELLDYDYKPNKGKIDLGAIDFSKKKKKHVVDLPTANAENYEPIGGIFDAKNDEKFEKDSSDKGTIQSKYETSYEPKKSGTQSSIIVNKRPDTFYGSINRGKEESKFENDIDEETLRRANEILARKDEIDIYEQPVSTVRITDDETHEDFRYIDDDHSFTRREENSDNSIEFIKAYGDEYDEPRGTSYGNNTFDDIYSYNKAEQSEPVNNESFKREETNVTDKLKNTLVSNDGEKTLVTAGGKVIVSDTQALQKKMEEQRANSPQGKIRNEIAKKVQRPYIYPGTFLLNKNTEAGEAISDSEYRNTAITLQETLASFDVNVTVEDISVGPSVTLYELKPEQGVKVSKVLSLANDIKLALAASDIRIEAPIPGKSAIGIEVPNKQKQTVFLRDLFESRAFKNGNESIGFAVGKDISGKVIVSDIAKMPHVLIAGATGSGKSVCINTLIMSIIYKYSPEDVKLIMVDPKVVELSVYNGIPHLLIPVVTEPKKAASALNWAVAEMGERYKKFAATGVRDLTAYNKRIEEAKRRGNIEGLPEKLPKIVIIIDELADLMMVANNEVEDAIVRLAQLARACGIHLVIATQRPSVNVITGIIKANIPSRIAFAVSSGTDSRTILDSNGAEKLLGKGDMLFAPYGSATPVRVQGAFVSDEEVSAVVDFLKNQGMQATYDENTIKQIEETQNAASAGNNISERDELFEAAGRYIIEKDKSSIGNLQRNFKIGFNRAARIMDQLASAGVVGGEAGTKKREILMNMDEFLDVL